MTVIVSAPYSEIKQFRGKNVITKIGNKKNNVYFRVTIDDFCIDEVLNTPDNNILLYDYQGMDSNPTYLGISKSNQYITCSYEFGTDISEDDVINILEKTPAGVTPIIKLPEDFKNFELVCRMLDKYDRVRFCGGTLFNAKSLRVGCCGRDILDKKDIKYPEGDYITKGCSCALPVLPLESVDLQISETKIKSASKKNSSSTSKPKPKKMFSDFFNGVQGFGF